MVVKIIEQRKNPLLKREEVRCIFEHPGKATPSRSEMLPELEKVLKTKKELIIIDKIFSLKGKGESKVHILVYKKKEDIPKGKLEKMERRMRKKGKPAQEVKPEGKAEEKPEGAKEEKVGEKPEEGEEEKQEGETKPEGPEKEKPPEKEAAGESEEKKEGAGKEGEKTEA